MSDGPYYRDMECPNCGRWRVATDGVCEKCLWDVDGDNYAGVTRPNDYDADGQISHLPENDPFKEAPAVHRFERREGMVVGRRFPRGWWVAWSADWNGRDSVATTWYRTKDQAEKAVKEIRWVLQEVNPDEVIGTSK